MTPDASLEPLDLLAVGPHPDDVEIGMGATVAAHARQGYRVGLVDLSRGERASNGDPALRLAEAEAARAVLGAAVRTNLGLADGALGPTGPNLRALVEAIRRFRPAILFAPYWEDRHPDHVDASHLVTRAWHAAGLVRFDAAGAPFRPGWLVYYFIHTLGPASLVVDVSETYAAKRQALLAHASQFTLAAPGTVPTPLNQGGYLAALEARDRYLGSLIGAAYGEAFTLRGPVPLADFGQLPGRGAGGSPPAAGEGGGEGRTWAG